MPLPEGSRCELCAQLGPKSQMAWCEVRYDPADTVHQRIVATLPKLWQPLLRPGSRLVIWAHAHGFGCDSAAHTNPQS